MNEKSFVKHTVKFSTAGSEKTNKAIDKFNKDIELLRSNIKNKVSTSHFESITEVIFKSKEKLFKQIKQRQVRKFRHLQKTPAYRNTPVPEHISKKWVINLASKDLSPGEVKLLQKGPKFAVSTPKVPITEYIAVTKQICDKLGENTEGVDCSEYYQKPRISSKTTHASVQPIPTYPKWKGMPSEPLRKTTHESYLLQTKGSHGGHGQKLLR